jgi:hypothetical protein
MPCPCCGRSVLGDSVCRVRYCYCRACNHCHVGGICPCGKFWYVQKIDGKRDSRKPFIPGQSDGGSGWVPHCDPCNCGGGGAFVPKKKGTVVPKKDGTVVPKKDDRRL